MDCELVGTAHPTSCEPSHLLGKAESGDPHRTQLLRHTRPLLIEPLLRRGDRRAEFLSEDRDAVLLGHPTVGFELWVVELSLAMLLQAFDASLAPRNDRR